MTKNAGSSTVALIDARVAGVSGDKFLGALIDLGGSPSKLKAVGRVVKECLPGTREIDIQTRGVERGEIGAKLVTVSTKEDSGKRRGEVLRKAVVDSARGLRLSEWGSNFAIATVETLLKAESAVHRQSQEKVELHELGSADTIVDILGVAALVEELGLDKALWWSTPVAVGGGVSHFSSRDYPNPPPAVAEILRFRRVPLVADTIKHELSTPTGVSITINLARKVVEHVPAFRIDEIGYGAGSKELKEVANVLRIMVGRSNLSSHTHDRMVLLETNLDDVTGEVIGHAVEKIMACGARDVSVTPVFMKKNRPGHLISIIVDEAKVEEVAHVLMEETGTLGVREIPIRRHIAYRTTQRKVINVGGRRYPISVKSAMDERGKIVRQKAEYEDRKKLSEKTGLSLRQVDRMVKSHSSKE